MSKYTTSIEVIISSQSHHQYDIYERIEDGRSFLFDFDYPVPNADFKKSFETQFIEKYWQDCIGFETVPLFKMKLKQKLEMLMPEIIFKYNALNKIIESDPTIERRTTTNGETNQNATGNTKSTNTATSESSSSVNSSGTNNNKTVNSDLPQNVINASSIGEVQYASAGGISEGANTSTTGGTSTSSSDSNVETDSTNQSNTTIENKFIEYGNEMKLYFEYYNSYINLMQELLSHFDSMFIPLLF